MTKQEKREFGKLRIRHNLSQLAKMGCIDSYPGYEPTVELSEKEKARLNILQAMFDRGKK